MTPVKAIVGLLMAVALSGQPEPKRLFIEQRTLNYTNAIGVTRAQRNVTLELTKAILKRCPNLITVTDKAETAKYTLRISPGSSALYFDGDVVATFSARFLVGNLAKDVCEWTAANASSDTASGDHLNNFSGPNSDRTSNPAASTPTETREQPPSATVLKNSDILALKQAGLSDSLIIEKIMSSPGRYSLETDDLVSLKKAGVADSVISAMLEASKR